MISKISCVNELIQIMVQIVRNDHQTVLYFSHGRQMATHVSYHHIHYLQTANLRTYMS